jgi:hypothetical protein
MEKVLKNKIYYSCELCNYSTTRKSQYNRHIITIKHKILNNNNNENVSITNKYICNCGREYKHASSLSLHKKKCINNISNINNINNINNIKTNKIITNDLILKLIEQNEKLQNQIIELSKEKQIVNNNNNTNCNNKTFNLQFFLNETCKNAMNLNQFVDNIDITMDDLKNTRINGLVEGVSDIIIRGLKQLEIHERPIHCTDLKRDTLYIKDNEKWCKDENNEIFKETIEEIIEKEQYALNMWTDAHPDWDKVTHLQDEYVLMVNRLYQPVMEDEKKEKKIIHNISKEVYIQK